MEGDVRQVNFSAQGDQIRFDAHAVKMRLGGYWLMAANRAVTRAELEQLRQDNPEIQFVAVPSAEEEQSA